MRSISGHVRAVAVCLTALAATFCCGQKRFVQVPSYSAGGSLPTLLAQHDVNGDGKLDLIVLTVNTTAKTETVRLLLGTGMGGYDAPKTMGTYPSSYGVPLVGDVNRDGHLDLIFSVGGTSPQTRVYLGTGETVETTAKVSTGVNCASFPPVGCEMQLSDLNKDGNPDLVEYGKNGVATMLGEGNGSFRPPVYAPNSSGPFTVGDFNNDGIPDLADTGHIGSSNGLQIQFGNGNGTFRSGNSLVYPYLNKQGGAFGVPVAADLRGNGDTDVIIPLGDNSTCGYGGFVVLLGNGNGTFASAPVRYGAGGFTYGITITDMNGDGKPDIVAANQEGSSYSIFLNQGGGKFGTPMNYMAPQGVAGNFVAGDLTGNGRPDLTVSIQSGVDVFLNEGGGKLKAPGALELDAEPGTAWAVDLNKDGIPDLEVDLSPPSSGCTGGSEPFAEVLVSRSGVPFANANLTNGTGQIAGGGDFNGDGYQDLLMQSSNSSDGDTILNIRFNNHQGAFPTGGPIMDTGNEAGPVAAGDFNRDGYADVAENLEDATGTLQIALGNGKGNLKNGASYTASPFTTNIYARDLNGDGKLDLVLLSGFSDQVIVFLGNGNGTFETPQSYAIGDVTNSLAFADFNNDGKLDIAFGGLEGVGVLLNNGDGTFKDAKYYPVGPAGGQIYTIATIDLTGDGNADVLAVSGDIYLLTGNGKGALSAAVDYYSGGANPLQLIVADYNLDGAPDVAVADQMQGFMVLYNTGGTRVTLTSSNKTPIAGQTVTFTATVAASVPGSGTTTGTVTFKNGSATLGTATLSGGKATFHTASLSKGTHLITAHYNGSSSFNPHVSAVVTETVN